MEQTGSGFFQRRKMLHERLIGLYRKNSDTSKYIFKLQKFGDVHDPTKTLYENLCRVPANYCDNPVYKQILDIVIEHQYEMRELGNLSDGYYSRYVFSNISVFLDRLIPKMDNVDDVRFRKHILCANAKIKHEIMRRMVNSDVDIGATRSQAIWNMLKVMRVFARLDRENWPLPLKMITHSSHHMAMDGNIVVIRNKYMTMLDYILDDNQLECFNNLSASETDDGNLTNNQKKTLVKYLTHIRNIFDGTDEPIIKDIDDAIHYAIGRRSTPTVIRRQNAIKFRVHPSSGSSAQLARKAAVAPMPGVPEEVRTVRRIIVRPKQSNSE